MVFGDMWRKDAVDTFRGYDAGPRGRPVYFLRRWATAGSEYELTDDSSVQRFVQRKNPVAPTGPFLAPTMLQVLLSESAGSSSSSSCRENWIAVDFRSQLQAQFYGKQSGIVPFFGLQSRGASPGPRGPAEYQVITLG